MILIMGKKSTMKKTSILILLLICFAQSNYAQNIEGLKSATPFAYSGAIAAHTGFYQANGITARSPQSIWGFSGNMNFTLYDKINLPFSFTVGRYGNSTTYPTFGQVGISPNYKWATVHLGYRNMTFSPYTLAGHTFLGAGVELNPGKLRVGAMYGRLRNAAEVDTTHSFVQPAFKRLGYGLKLGVGKSNKYIDFIFFRAKDEENSLEKIQNEITPSENLVVGISTQFPLFNIFTFKYDVGTSIFTRNQNSTEVLLDSLPNGLEKYIKGDFFDVKASTRANLANKASLAFNRSKVFRVKVEYERIDPQYETMGAYFFANDLERLTISPSFQLFKNKVSLNGSYGLQRNNLLGDRIETTQKSIGAANIDIHPNATFGLNLNYSNYSIYQEAGRLDLNDTVAFNLATTTIGITPRFNVQGKKVMHSVVLNGNYQRSNQDNDLFYDKSQNFESTLIGINHSLVFIENRFSLNTGINYHVFSVADVETALMGGSIGMNLPVADNKLNIGLSGSLNARRLNKIRDGNTLSSYLNLSYRVAKAHSFRLNFGYLKNFGTILNDFSELRGGLSYTFILAPKLKKQGKIKR